MSFFINILIKNGVFYEQCNLILLDSRQIVSYPHIIARNLFVNFLVNYAKNSQKKVHLLQNKLPDKINSPIFVPTRNYKRCFYQRIVGVSIFRIFLK